MLLRQLERKWQSNGKLEIDRQLFSDQRKAVNKLVLKAKRTYFINLIDNCGNDSKRLFNVGNQLLNRKKSSPLPPHTCSQSLALLFSKFFHSKINNICSGFTPDVTTPLPDETSMILCSFKQTTAEEIQRILQSIPPKSCDLDPIPTSLLKDCMSTFATIIAEIVNLSFQQASVPSSLKLAYIHPLLKKPSLDPDVLQNYRPVSNLPFLSKVLERTFHVCLVLFNNQDIHYAQGLTLIF